MVFRGNEEGWQMRFNGRSQHTVDDKGRVSLPAKFRKALPDEVIVVPSIPGRGEEALYVFAEDEFEAWIDSFFKKKEDGSEGYNPRSKKDVKLRKFLNANAETVSVDAAGRIKLSATQRADRGIEKNVTIIGDEDHLEIWDSETYDAYMAEDMNFDDLWED